jgi:hypothetical protein
MRHQEERLVVIALLEPIEGEVADQIGAVAFVLFLSGGSDEGRIVVDALPGKNIPIVETCGVGFSNAICRSWRFDSRPAAFVWRRCRGWDRWRR